MALTGHRLRGSDVFLTGIATHFCKAHKMRELECELLYCNNSADINQTLNKYNQPVKTPMSLSKHMEQINDCFNTSSIEEVLENLELDESRWAQKTKSCLERMSPTSLKITMKALDLGSKMSLNDCLNMEYKLLSSQLGSGDFNEGIKLGYVEPLIILLGCLRSESLNIR